MNRGTRYKWLVKVTRPDAYGIVAGCGFGMLASVVYVRLQSGINYYELGVVGASALLIGTLLRISAREQPRDAPKQKP